MDDIEKVFAEGLRRAASERPALPVDVDEVVARGEAMGREPARRPTWRWLAVAAAALLVAGVGVWYLNRPGVVPAVPVASPMVSSPDLTGTRWLATEIGGRPVEQVGPTMNGERVPWLVFDATTVSGADPCNGVGADYRLEGDRLSFSNWGAHTDVGCNTTQQQRFEKALTDTTRVQRDGDSLALLDARGSTVARFAAESGRSSPSATILPSVAIHRVAIRVRNAATDDLTQIRLYFADGSTAEFPDLPAGSTSDRRVVSVSPLVGAGASVGGHTYMVTDPGANDDPLLQGVYTCTLVFAAQGQLSLSLQKDG